MYINNKEHGDNNIFKIVQDLKLGNPNAYSGAVYIMARMLGVHSTSVYSSCDQEDTDKLCMAIILQRNPRYRLNRANKFVIDFFKRYTLEDVRNNFYISKSKPRWIIKQKKVKQVELVSEASVEIKPIEQPVPFLRRIENNRRRFMISASKPVASINSNKDELINMDKLKQLIEEIVEQKISGTKENTTAQFVVPVNKNKQGKRYRENRFINVFTIKNVKDIFKERLIIPKAEFTKALHSLAYGSINATQDVCNSYFSNAINRHFKDDENIMKYYHQIYGNKGLRQVNYHDLVKLAVACQNHIANKRTYRIAA